MSTTSSARRAARRQSQDGSADKVVVNLDASSPVAGSRPGLTVCPGARTSPIDVEALDDEVQAVSPSQVPPPRVIRRTRPHVTIVDLEVDATPEVNKRPRITPLMHLFPERGEGSSLQSSNAAKISEEPAKAVVPKEPSFDCPVCWNKLVEPSTTNCGHIFCTECIKQAIQYQKKCPTCRKALRKNNFHRIYLPNSHA
ncbi:E3 ubiquitin-protein ligase RNF4-like [Lolium rigidum]|uniref:E3 ubiquitin-protein ligase RNF4-like n=1 Tax=Lolium rigidum TaxID=89674 RepID=UPI001F5CC4D8|nr:E3 ubiquitin-protein ligase RNF4-like [Lolium rigidum]